MNLEVLFWSDSQQLELLRTEGRVLEALMNAMDDAGIELPVDIVALHATSRFAAALMTGVGCEISLDDQRQGAPARLPLGTAPGFGDRLATPRQRDREPGEGGQQGDDTSEGDGDGGGIEHVGHEKHHGYEGDGQ